MNVSRNTRDMISDRARMLADINRLERKIRDAIGDEYNVHVGDRVMCWNQSLWVTRTTLIFHGENPGFYISGVARNSSGKTHSHKWDPEYCHVTKPFTTNL